MSELQVAYSVALAVLVYWRGGYAVWCLVANLAAFLAAGYALDVGAIARTDATLWYAVIDFASGAALATRGGYPRVIAVGYAITIPIYTLDLVFQVSTTTTFAIVWVVVLMQLWVAALGSSGDNNSSGGRRRYRASAASLGASIGNNRVGEICLAQGQICGAQGAAFFSGRE